MSALQPLEATRGTAVSARPAEEINDEARMARAVIVLAKATRALQGLRLAELGLQNGQDELLLSLDEAGKTVSAAAGELDIRPSTVSKMVDRLAERQLVERIGDMADARRTIVRITSGGMQMRELLIEERRAFGTEVAATLPGDISIDALEGFAQGLVKRLRRLR